MKKLVVLQLTAFIALFALSAFAHAHGVTDLHPYDLAPYQENRP